MSEGADGPGDVGERVRTEIDRAIQRNIKGLDFLAAPRQAVGAMPKDALLRRGTLQFYRYRPVAAEIYRTPILIVSPTSNRGYVFDLARGQSLIEFLLTAGYDVFVIDWIAPHANESRLMLEDYLLDFLPACVERVQQVTGETQTTLFGYCMGGTLALLYAALVPQTVRNLILFATPVDFHEMKLFHAWANEKYFDVDRLVDTLGNIPGDFILNAFDITRPANRAAGVVHLWTNMWNDDYVKSYRMFDRWAAETLPLPGEYFRQTTKAFMWRNAIVNRELDVGGRRVDLTKIDMPLLSVVAQHDHVVPQAAAHAVMDMVSSAEREEMLVKGGHVSVVAGPAAVKRLWPAVDRWLAGRSI